MIFREKVPICAKYMQNPTQNEMLLHLFSSWWIFYGILIIPIYKKSVGAFLGLQPIGWLFNVMHTHDGGQSHFLQGISRST